MKTTLIAALVNGLPKPFLEIDKTLIIVNGDLFQQLAPRTMWPTWHFEEMTSAHTLICGSEAVIYNLYEFLHMQNERRRNKDSEAPRITCMWRILIFNWPTKPKSAGAPMVFDVRLLLIVA